MDSFPNTLYKYFSPDRVDVISSGMLRYSPPGAFNDPFEGRPEITPIEDLAEARQFFRALAPESVYESMPASVRSDFAYKQWEQIFSTWINQKDESFLRSLMQIMNASIPRIASHGLDKLFGVLCLTEYSDNLLMWAHYAQNHSGFVLEFSAHHPFFHNAHGPKGRLEPVMDLYFEGRYGT